MDTDGKKTHRKMRLMIRLEGSLVGVEEEGTRKWMFGKRTNSLTSPYSVLCLNVCSEKKMMASSYLHQELKQAEATWRIHSSSSSGNIIVFNNLRWELL